ncbi:3-oxoacyl-[acyl-carrier-protein] synthase II [Pedobacter cryoconitis]|uniref:3-oxoacyl-[acyl-carrier-protein] synthase 2 n=1 Tax=Pedobacter cryoconitis TaxID=188932 RepID=A0A7W9DYN2_9SPHI|nr:beta-ketoacyl-ACP synthase II [Pedobacter cryoconitis]MBB5635379.1 3-oxoacyl-[acyl-carrier-protein] synthase II [Pedobacter cryoconitis]MBB6273760.1 3-oxoacyl-[acyl-carrier-protein] synthase II [Pedobacter cryoconitis]
MELKRVVVTGLGALTPIGNTIPEFWDNLLKGVSGAAPITSFDTEKFKTKFACELKNFNPEDFLEKKEARKLDPFVQYAIASTDEAVKDAGFDFSQMDTNRVGVIWGTGIGGIKTFLEEMRNYFAGDGTPRINPFFIPKMIIDIVPGHISIKYGLRGPNFATVSACASSTNAMIDAFNYIRLNMADVIISGGSEAIINEAGIGGFNAMHALSTRNDDPSTASRPFDKDRDGFVAGEGAGTIILEELEHAKARGAKIYAELVGGGMSADANHITAPHPQGLGAKMVMTNALRDAGMDTGDIDYINVHGTSTSLGDISETSAIVNLFGEDAYKLNISSTKSMTGHLLGAAGAVEAIAAILAVQNDIVPPTINHFTDDPAFDPKLNFTFHEPQKRLVRAALSNTFGFGGHNASVIFKKYKE